jgi:UPF0148 protein
MQRKSREEEYIKKMADMLRKGSTLTDLACPACSAPLFRLKSGEILCVKCEKKVIIVKEGVDPEKIKNTIILENLEKTLLTRITEIQNKLQNETNIQEIEKLSLTLSTLLESLEKTRKTKRNLLESS